MTDPTDDPLFRSIDDDLSQFLERAGIEHDGIGTLGGPFRPAGSLLLSHPQVELHEAVGTPPRTSSENPRWLLRIATTTERHQWVYLYRSERPRFDAVELAEAPKHATRIELDPSDAQTLRLLWAKFTRWNEIHATQVRSLGDGESLTLSQQVELSRLEREVDEGVQYVTENLM